MKEKAETPVKVRLEHLTKRFGRVVAINDLSLEVMDGEFFVVVGPNACGKTTLLRLIAGLTKPNSGNIYIDGQLVNRVKPAKRGVRMVFQNYALYPHMKVYDPEKYSNLSFALRIRRYLAEGIRGIVSTVADQVGIERELFPRKPRELSEGQKQKVAVGRALTIPPRVFLMDEPLRNLDPPSRIRVMSEIRRIHNELGTTTIYVTHNLIEAIAMADRLGIMREGTIQQVGTVEQVCERPANDFVADFIKYHDYSYYLRAIRRGLSNRQ